MARRCKFTCNKITKQKGWSGVEFCYGYEFSAVTGGSLENKEFFAATPGGTINISGIKGDWFEVGKDYYLDIIPVETNE